jgi:hypothetical protein
VWTEDWLNKDGVGSYFINETNGIEAAVNAAFSGTPDCIHDGTDAVCWTASAVAGTWDFASTTQANSGTKSVEGINTTNNDEALFTRASAIATSGYTAVTMAVYLTSWVADKSELTIQFQLAGVNVGDALPISAYVVVANLGTWQSVVIPIADFNFGGSDTVDELSILVTGTGANAPDFYLDDMQFEEAGGGLVYAFPPIPRGSVFKFRELALSFAGPHQTYITATSHPNIPYNTFLNVASLTNGILLRKNGTKGAQVSGLFQNHFDIAGNPMMRVEFGGDGTDSWIIYTTDFREPAILDSQFNERAEIVISDDLSALHSFRIVARGTLETAPTTKL